MTTQDWWDATLYISLVAILAFVAWLGVKTC